MCSDAADDNYHCSEHVCSPCNKSLPPPVLDRTPHARRCSELDGTAHDKATAARPVNGLTPSDLSLAQTYSNVLWHEHLGFQTDVVIDGLEYNCTDDETEVPASLPMPDVHTTVLLMPFAGEGVTAHCINDHPSSLSPMKSTVDDKERAKQRHREERKRNRPDRPLPRRMDEHVPYDPGHAYVIHHVTRDQQCLLWYVWLIQHGRGGDVPDEYVRMDLGGDRSSSRSS